MWVQTVPRTESHSHHLECEEVHPSLFTKKRNFHGQLWVTQQSTVCWDPTEEIKCHEMPLIMEIVKIVLHRVHSSIGHRVREKQEHKKGRVCGRNSGQTFRGDMNLSTELFLEEEGRGRKRRRRRRRRENFIFSVSLLERGLQTQIKPFLKGFTSLPILVVCTVFLHLPSQVQSTKWAHRSNSGGTELPGNKALGEGKGKVSAGAPPWPFACLTRSPGGDYGNIPHVTRKTTQI